jgi:hypothetical protein
MIKNIHDLKLILDTTSDFTDSKGIDQKALLSTIQDKIKLIQWNVDLEKILELGILFNLIKEKNNNITLSDKGLDIIELNDEGLDLNSKQIKFIVENCFFGNSNFSQLVDFLKIFQFDKNIKKLTLDSKHYPIPKKLTTELLIQLKIVTVDSNIWKINSEYNQFIGIEENKIPITQEQIDKRLKEQKIIGEKAEELTIKFEKNRLRKIKLNQESENVNQISQDFANKGYDIESFSKKTPSLVHNLFIEVKGRSGRDKSFFMSSNEIQTAKQKGEQYAIYFWSNLGRKKNPTEPTEIIPDPVTNLNIQECDNCLNYLISLEKFRK